MQKRVSNLDEQDYLFLKDVSRESRQWCHKHFEISQSIDLINEKLLTKSESLPNLWDQIVFLTFKTMDLEDSKTQRESWLALGELRQAIRQAMAFNPELSNSQNHKYSFQEQFSDLIDYIYFQLSPDKFKCS